MLILPAFDFGVYLGYEGMRLSDAGLELLPIASNCNKWRADIRMHLVVYLNFMLSRTFSPGLFPGVSSSIFSVYVWGVLRF
jgi:hypothetical protein